ncbi:MAG: NAD(P)H-hydrate dehydratase [Bacteroides sp.]|nr:NAD(P)H-hydrate dehydratase [Bacteroides sp.]
MKVFPASALREIDRLTIQNEPIASIDLMERASMALCDTFCKRWDKSVPVVIFAGPGNNGGDALALARLLSERGYCVKVFLFNPHDKLSPDCLINKELLELMPEVSLHEVKQSFTPPTLTHEHVLVDGLFGSGLDRPLTGGFAAVVNYINSSPATVMSIDLPSGLDTLGEHILPDASIVRADCTFSFQLPKPVFFLPDSEPFIGHWDLLDIGLDRQAIEEIDTPYELTEPRAVALMNRPRSFFAHKGHFGHGLLIAGSMGMAGAAILAARACLRSGIGKLTVQTPPCNNIIIQTTVPEATTSVGFHEHCFAEAIDSDPYTALAIGPGLGQSDDTAFAFMELLKHNRRPLIIDADGLNLLGKDRTALRLLPPDSILTPHPAELERIVGSCRNAYERLTKAAELCRQTGACLILKGAFSTVVTPDGQFFINTSGNPGMATAGSGDVLTGILLALMAQGYSACDAARMAAFVHGKAGDFAAKQLGETALTAGDIIRHLPAAWKFISE